VLTEPAPTGDGGATVAAVLVETNVDDVTPEVLAHTVARALEAGADDAWVVPVTMKKGRPAHQVRVLCRPERADALRRLLAAETGTLGLRQWTVTKYELDRRHGSVTVGGQVIGMKVGPHGAKPEFDDVAAAAAATGRPVREVATAAMDRWAAADTGPDPVTDRGDRP